MPESDSTWNELYRGGGVAFMLVGILIFVDVLEGTLSGGVPPNNATGEQLLQFVAAHATAYWYSELLLALAAAPLIPGALALFASLRDVRKGYVVVGVAMLIGGALLIMAEETAPLSLFDLSQGYSAATSDAQRAMFASAALAADAMDRDLLPFVLLSVGTFLSSIVMRKSAFGRGIGYLGIAAAILGFGAVILSGSLIARHNLFSPGSTILFAVWSLLVGYKLYKLGGLKS